MDNQGYSGVHNRNGSDGSGFLHSFSAFIMSLFLKIVSLFNPSSDGSSGPNIKSLAIRNQTFVVLKKLGEGGFSFVYLVKPSSARSSPSGTGPRFASYERFALKHIRIQLPEQEERLLQEIRAHQMVESPHVIKLIDHEIVKDGVGAVVEGRLLLPFYDSGTLQDMIDRSRSHDHISLDVILKISIDICKGLLAFHSHNPPLAFRDLKPANVLLDNHHKAVLMDLGSVTLARVTISSRKEAIALQELCAETVTAPFRAPELFDPPSNAQITELSDVWALGCTIYAMAYGESPFDGTLTAAIGGVINTPTPNPYGPQFLDLVRSLVQPNPLKRPSIPEIMSKLERYASSLSFNPSNV